MNFLFSKNFEWDLPNLIQHIAKVYPDNDFVNEYSQRFKKETHLSNRLWTSVFVFSVAKLAEGTLVDLIDLFQDLSRFIQKRNENNTTNNENQLHPPTDKVFYTVKGWSLVGKFFSSNLQFSIRRQVEHNPLGRNSIKSKCFDEENHSILENSSLFSCCSSGMFLRRHICSFEILSTPHLEQLVHQVRRYVDSYLRSSIFKCPLPPKDERMVTETNSTTESKKISLRDLRIMTKQL